MDVRWVLAAVVATLLVGCGEQVQVGQGSVTEVPVSEVSTSGAVAAGGGTVGVSSSAACAAILEFDGRFYDGHSVKKRPAAGEALGTGTFPPCNDTGGASEEAESVEVLSIPDVDPRDAVLSSGGGGRTVWVNGQRLGEKGVRLLVAQFD